MGKFWFISIFIVFILLNAGLRTSFRSVINNESGWLVYAFFLLIIYIIIGFVMYIFAKKGNFTRKNYINSYLFFIISFFIFPILFQIITLAYMIYSFRTTVGIDTQKEEKC